MADEDRTYMLSYDYVDDMLERRTAHRDAHLAHVKSQRDAGHKRQAGADPSFVVKLLFTNSLYHAPPEVGDYQ